MPADRNTRTDNFPAVVRIAWPNTDCEHCGGPIDVDVDTLGRTGVSADTVTGWRAECSDCPAVVEPDYGARVFPSEEFEDTDAGKAAADRWSDEHWAANPGHSPTVTLIHRFTMTSVEHLDLRVLERLFGKPAEPPAEPWYSDLDDLRDTIYWARNVAYSELGIETGGEQLAITSKWRPVGDPTRTFPPPPGARMPADWLYPPPAGWWDVGKLGPEGIR